MKSFKPLFALLLVTGLVSACTGTSSLPTAPSSSSSPASGSSGAGSSSSGPAAITDQLSGGWNLQSIQLTGQSSQAKPASAAYTLTLADGRLSTRVDCNICGGSFTLSGQTLVAGPALACTRAACPTDAFASEYTAVLSGESTVLLAGSTLELSSARGVLRFTR